MAKILGTGRGEGMMHGYAAVFFLVLVEHRKFDDPREVHLLGVVQFQFGSQSASQSVETFAGHIPSSRPATEASRPAGAENFDLKLSSTSGSTFLADRRPQRTIGFDAKPSQSLGSKIVLDKLRQLVDPLSRELLGSLARP